MKKTPRIQRLEAAFDQPIGALLRDLYEAEGYSQHEVADHLTAALPDDEEVPRTTLAYWFREYGVDMRSRTLSDVQRIVIMALLPYCRNRTIADRAGCHRSTVEEYRREITRTGAPVDLSGDIPLTDRDRAILAPDDPSEHTVATGHPPTPTPTRRHDTTTGEGQGDAQDGEATGGSAVPETDDDADDTGDDAGTVSATTTRTN